MTVLIFTLGEFNTLLKNYDAITSLKDGTVMYLQDSNWITAFMHD